MVELQLTETEANLILRVLDVTTCGEGMWFSEIERNVLTRLAQELVEQVIHEEKHDGQWGTYATE